MTVAVSTRTRNTMGLLLVVGMFLLRIPFVLAGAWLYPQSINSMMAIYTMGTYLVTAGLLLWERDRLAHFHMDTWAISLWVLMPTLTWAVTTRLGMPLPWLPWCVGIVVVAGLVLLAKRPRPSRGGAKIGAWVGAAIAVGIVYSGFLAFGARHWAHVGTGVGAAALLQALPAILVQMTTAAGTEEPFFRGFLWGYLRDAGWQEWWIWLLQAGLFLLGHLEGGHQGFYLYQVPLAALLFGWLAWRSRSISTSMIAHGLSNALGNALSRF